MQRGVEKESICASKLLFPTVMSIFQSGSRISQHLQLNISNTIEEQFSGQLFLKLVVSFKTYNKVQWQYRNFQKKS